MAKKPNVSVTGRSLRNSAWRRGETVSNQPEARHQPGGCAKPGLALRVGVTGTRTLDVNRLANLREKTAAVLAGIRQEMERLAKEPAVASHYAHMGGASPPFLRIISPIALGADRLVAREALNAGYQLYVPMPFPRAEYEEDFTGTMPPKNPSVPPLSAAEDLAEFRALLSQAGDHWMALDGNHADVRDRAYESVGRFVVRNSDIVIAIWNGESAAGRGGTEEIVRYAASVGVPVWWIHATEDRPPVWIADVQDLRDPIGADADAKLVAYLQRQIRPPAPVPQPRHAGLADLIQPSRPEPIDPAAIYFNEKPFRKNFAANFLWKLHGRMMLMASGSPPPWTPPLKPKNDASAYWFPLYATADARAGDYASRYRSSYVWIFLLTPLSLLFGSLAIMLHGRDIPRFLSFGHQLAADHAVATFAALEFVCLFGIFLIVRNALRNAWHERSIEYRLLAELCRKQQVLASLGRALSFGVVQRLATQEDDLDLPATDTQPASKLPPEPDRSAWVTWLFMAYQRASVLPRGNIASLLPGVVSHDVLQDLVDEQLDYHRGRAQMAEAAALFFEKPAKPIFITVLACVLLKIGLTLRDPPPGYFTDWLTAILGALCIVLPAVSAAVVGISSYAEWGLLAQESNHMLKLLAQAKKRIMRIDLRRPLASQDLGVEADAVASMMLQDLEGWQRLFRVKIIDT